MDTVGYRCPADNRQSVTEVVHVALGARSGSYANTSLTLATRLSACTAYKLGRLQNRDFNETEFGVGGFGKVSKDKKRAATGDQQLGIPEQRDVAFDNRL